MAAPITVPISPGVTVSDNYVIRFTALNPTTGATVAGVTVSASSILGNDTTGSTSNEIPAPLPLLVPSDV